jgi:cell division protein FtsQ
MQPVDLPLDVRLMTVVTRGLVMVCVLLCLGTAGAWISRHPAWAVRDISVQGDVSHQNAVGLRAQLASPLRRLQGSFLTIDLQQVRQMFEDVPWVRHAMVQREFPNRLRVTLEEHQVAAWWGQSGSGQLVSQRGEVFEASPDDGDGLPELAGPVEQAPQILRLHQMLTTELGRLEMGLVRLELNERGSWRAELDNGARLELGRGSPEDILTRTQRFTATLGQLTQRYPGALQSVDLRYPNGYALRVQGVTTVTDDTGKPANPTR